MGWRSLPTKSPARKKIIHALQRSEAGSSELHAILARIMRRRESVWTSSWAKGLWRRRSSASLPKVVTGLGLWSVGQGSLGGFVQAA